MSEKTTRTKRARREPLSRERLLNEYAEAAAQFLPMVPVELYPHLRGLSEEVIARRHDGVQELALGLDLLLDGLEALRSAALR